MLKLRFIAVGAALLGGSAFIGSSALVSSSAGTDARSVMVELFTSQGCSSCPPADALLGELAQRGDVLALGFHISYWDGLGWKDPFSSQSATDRQRSYARLLGRGQVYTPQMVVEGKSEMVGSDRNAVLAALRQARPQVVAPITFAADRRMVTVGAGQGSGTVLLVRYARTRSTRVAAGENARRTLEDANAVETLTTLGGWDGSSATFAVDPPGAGEGLAVLVQAPDGRILGAAALQAEARS
jgi:hypothetical protein